MIPSPPPPFPSPDNVRAAAAALGFVATGIADLAPSRYGDALDDWLARGYAGTMRYLHRQAAKRKEPARIVPGAARAVVLLDNYYPAATTPPGIRVAKYARGRDYHRVTYDRLVRLASWLRTRGAKVARVFVDAGPVPERELAQRAGLGWIGKNTMLIRPGAGGGSFFFIGAVFTDLPLATDLPFITDHCGSCTRCLDACPTEAFVAPRVLDATRCISYLTIEHRGPIPDDLIPKFEGWGFGCDICNDVCPWNVKFATPTPIEAFHPTAAPQPDTTDPRYFDRLTPEAFSARFGETPLERPGLEGMRRNWEAASRSVGSRPWR